MNLVGAVQESQRPAAAPQPRQRRIGCQTHGAEDLHPTIDDPRLQLRRDELDRRCIHPRFAWAFGVHSRRMKHEQARLVDLQSRMGDPVLNIREVADALPESGRSRARSHTSSSASSHWPTLRMA